MWAPEAKLGLELVTRAKALGDVAVAVVGEKAADAPTYADRGVKTVYTVESPNLKHLESGAVTDALAAVAVKCGAKLVLLPATRKGKEVAPRLAVRLKAACVTNAAAVAKEGEGFSFERGFLGGKTVATEVPTSAVVVATVPPHATEPAPGGQGNAPVEAVTADVKAPVVKVLATKPRETSGVNLEEAEVVVAAGRGFKNKDDLKWAFDIAKVLGGQVGCSRPLATDLGWLTDEYWIGLSGKNVRPKLYVALGISGQIQHVTGIRNSEVIVAVNSNKDAPIFKVADYGIVGDLYKVAPALLAALKAELGK